VWAFTTFQEGIWHPLTWLSLALDHAIYGLDPRGFHLTNLLLHVANTVLVFVVWCRLTGAVARSLLVAALFGLHPMHVESVAWVTERKDVLSTLFWLLTILAYARYVRVATLAAYLLVVVAFALGLLAKPMLVTLPFVLLLLDWWPLDRLDRRAVLEKIPLLVLALAVIVVGVWAVAGVSAEAVPDPIPHGARIANAIVATTQYLWLTIWPLHLSPWYSHPWFEGAPVGRGWRRARVSRRRSRSAARRTPTALVGGSGPRDARAGGPAPTPPGWRTATRIPHIGLFVAIIWPPLRSAPWRAVAPRRAAAVATVTGPAAGATAWRRVWANDHAFWGLRCASTTTSSRTRRSAARCRRKGSRAKSRSPPRCGSARSSRRCISRSVACSRGRGSPDPRRRSCGRASR
jgi:hypothetical protein